MKGVPLLVEFATGSRFERGEPDLRPLPHYLARRPSVAVRLGNGAEVLLPPDQVVHGETREDRASVGLGGMAFEGLRDGRLVFWRVRDADSWGDNEDYSSEWTGKLELEPGQVRRIMRDGSQVWPRPA